MKIAPKVAGKTISASFYCYPSSHLCLLWSDVVFAWPFHSTTKTNGDRKKREHRWGVSVPGCAWSSSSSASCNYRRERARPPSVSVELTDDRGGGAARTCSGYRGEKLSPLIYSNLHSQRRIRKCWNLLVCRAPVSMLLMWVCASKFIQKNTKQMKMNFSLSLIRT